MTYSVSMRLLNPTSTVTDTDRDVCLTGQAELRGALIELGEVEHAMEDVMGLLQQVEADLQQFSDVYGDPRHIEVHLRKIQAS